MKTFFTLIAGCFITYSFAQQNYLDQSFGNSGKAYGNRQTSGGKVQTIVQPDGKILQQASVYDNAGRYKGFGVVRFNANGTVDNNFGTNGYAYTPFGQYFGAESYTIALQADNKIVVGGFSANDVDFLSDATLVRYNSDGTLDNTFNGTGKTVSRIGSYNTVIDDIKIQPDGKILAAGSYYTYADQLMHSLVLRYNSNGSLDNTFGTAGVITNVYGTSSDDVYHLALQIDGKILVTGSATVSGHTQFVTRRYNNDGSSDNTFGAAGQVITNIGSQSNDATAILVQADGKIVIGGSSTYTGSTPQLAVVRYNGDGTIDNTFNATTFTYGYRLINGGNLGGTLFSILQQRDGKLLFGGELDNRSPISQATTSDFVVMRLNADGTSDRISDGNGTSAFQVIVDLGATDNGGFISFQGTNIIIGGRTSYFAPGSSFESSQTGVARILNSVGGLLPVTLVSFTAQKQTNNSVLVQWKTSSEINTNYFVVERSGDAAHFQTIGKVNAAGNSSNEILYALTDDKPLKGINYYRLKQVDKDGKINYSDVQTVNTDGPAGNLVKCFPNPATDVLRLEFAKELQQPVTVTVSNASGTIVSKTNCVSNNSSVLIDVKAFARGVYFIRATAGTETSTQTVVLH